MPPNLNVPSGNQAEYVLRIKAELDTSLQRSINQMANLRGELNTLSRTISQQSAALKAAGGDTAVYEQTLASLRSQYQATSTAAQGLSTATAGTATASRGSLDAIRAVSTQVGDFGVQVSSGTSALTAFSQQVPQLLGQLGIAATGFTGIGIAIGVLVASFAPLILKLFDLKDATEEYEKAAKGLQSVLADVGKAGNEFSFDSLIKQYNAADAKTRELIVNQVRLQQAIIETARVTAQQALKATEPSINLGAFGGVTTGLEGVAGGFNPMATRQQTQDLREQAQNTALVADAQKRLGIETEGSARQFVALRSVLAKGNIGFEAAAKSLREIVDANKGILNPALAAEVQKIQKLIVAEQDYANAKKASNQFLKDSAGLQDIPVEEKATKGRTKATQDYANELVALELQLKKLNTEFTALDEFNFKVEKGTLKVTDAEAARVRELLKTIEVTKKYLAEAEKLNKQEETATELITQTNFELVKAQAIFANGGEPLGKYAEFALRVAEGLEKSFTPEQIDRIQFWNRRADEQNQILKANIELRKRAQEEALKRGNVDTDTGAGNDRLAASAQTLYEKYLPLTSQAEKLKAQIVDLQAAFAINKLPPGTTAEQYSQIIQGLQKELATLGQPAGPLEIVTNNFNSFFDNLQKGTADASEAFKRMTQSIVAQLARLALNKLFVSLLNSAFGAGSFSINASNAIQIGGPRAMGSVGSSGDMLRSIGSIPSIRDGSSTGISASSSSSDSLVNVNVVNNTTSQVSVQDQGNGDISIFIDQVKKSIARDIGQGTGIAKSFERVYGVGRYSGAV